VSDRQHLLAEPLRSAVVAPESLWTSLEVITTVGSSNTELAQRAKVGSAVSGAVLVVEEQTEGRGRRDRTWMAPRYSSVMVSLLVEPDVDSSRWGWLPLVAALSVTDAISDTHPSIKWPNDVMVGESKVAGILSEVVPTSRGTGVVVGIGINVDQDRDELPHPDATSVRLCGGASDRAAILVDLLRSWERWYRLWSEGAAAPVDAYRLRSATLGSQVRVHLPDGTVLVGLARDLTDDGHLVVELDGVDRVVAAADVVHVRRSGLSP
jgi:BirA family biotin operon repressor/biotin-[acetyl-CoA-carboxylase] ligase